jgi:uncharacterized membrane protein
MKLSAITGRIHWRLIVISILAAAIMHIVATLVAPYLQTANAYARASARLPLNQFTVLPAIAPQTQVLPFLVPDFRYAVCRFDARSGPIVVRSTLAEPGWMLSVTSSGGDNVYATQAVAGGRREIALRLIPPGERFVDLVGDQQSLSAIQVPLPSTTGLVVVRAPLGGGAFRGRIEQGLATSTCALQGP